MTVHVFLKNGHVMVLKIAITEQMKIQNSVPAVHFSFSVQTAGAQTRKMFVMDEIIAGITATKLKSVMLVSCCKDYIVFPIKKFPPLSFSSSKRCLLYKGIRTKSQEL